VHSSEGLNFVTVSPKLDAAVYLAWTRAMRRALGAKNMFQCVDGSIPFPASSVPNCHTWEHCNNHIHYFVNNLVSSKIS